MSIVLDFYKFGQYKFVATRRQFILDSPLVYCKCIFQKFRLFHLDVACFHLDIVYVAVAIRVCCNCMFKNVSPVLDMCCKCFIWMFHMLHWLYTCCKHMFQFVSPCFSILQQVLLPTCSNSRACTHPASTAYLYHGDQLQQSDALHH